MSVSKHALARSCSLISLSPQLFNQLHPISMTETTVHNNNELIMQSITDTISGSNDQSLIKILQLVLDSNNSNQISDNQIDSPKHPEIIQYALPESPIDNNANFGLRRARNPKEKEEERRRQMAKNREYARKCVQKKKEQRNGAADRSDKLFEMTEQLRKNTANKEKNAHFAVELLKMTEEEMTETKRKYEEKKAETVEKMEKAETEDDTVNINYGRLEDAKEEFKKATEDLRTKNGVIGTLGSRKIRAKQHMEWRLHLYNISVQEHRLTREKALAKLVDDYVFETVPRAAPLVKTIPKQVLDELIRCNQTGQLEEFYRFVEQNSLLFETMRADGVG